VENISEKTLSVVMRRSRNNSRHTIFLQLLSEYIAGSSKQDNETSGFIKSTEYL
jgi:hypothetical protein